MRLLPLAYVLIGAFVAADHHYFSHTGSLAAIASVVVAILLWPLVVFGIHISVH